MIYKRRNHSKYLLIYHVIFVCKYRRNVLIGYENDLKQILHCIALKSDFDILEMECDKDHIHLLVESCPKISILSIVRRWKQESTINMWKQQGAFLKSYYWRENTLWSDGYFCCTIGNVSKATITKYIQDQG